LAAFFAAFFFFAIAPDPPFPGLGCASDRTAVGLDPQPPGPRSPGRSVFRLESTRRALSARGGNAREARAESGLKEVGGDQSVTPARFRAYRFFAAFFLAAFFAFFAILPPK
jgi:hypothetical protein